MINIQNHLKVSSVCWGKGGPLTTQGPKYGKSSSFQLSLLLRPRVRGFKTYNFQAFLDTETLLKNFQIVLKFISFKLLLLQKSATAALQKYRGVALAMGSEVRNVGRSSCHEVSLYFHTLLGGGEIYRFQVFVRQRITFKII